MRNPFHLSSHENKRGIRTYYEQQETTMIRRMMADVTELSVIGVFLGMIWTWATALAPGLGV
jgi:hypothetical protein